MKRFICGCSLITLLLIGGVANAQLDDGDVSFDPFATWQGTISRTFSRLATLPAATAPVQLIPKGAVWKYLDNGRDQGTAWRELAYSDGNWASGSAKLGYGDKDDVTVIGYGPDSAHKYITTYFRRTIIVPNPALVTGLRLNLQRDDGAVIYVNGVEAGRSNMPPGPVANTTLANLALSGTDETEFVPFQIAPSLLVAGLNVIAVEVHQSDVSTTDAGFDLDLTADVVPDGGTAPVVTLTAPDTGSVFAAPGPIHLCVDAPDDDGTVATVAFYNGSQKIGETSQAPYAFSWPNVGPGTYTLRAVATDKSGTVAVSDPVSVTVGATSGSSANLFARNSVWRRLDNGTDQGTVWYAPDFNDRAWTAGPAIPNGENVPVITAKNGSDANKHITAYFRSEFTVSNPAAVSTLTLGLPRSAGAVVYLNGTEVTRSNLPPGKIVHRTLATRPAVVGTDTTVFSPVTLNPSSLLPGRNVLAVEVHQPTVNGGGSGFDLDLIADEPQPGSGSLTRGPYLQKASASRMTIRWRSSGNIAGRVHYGTAVNALTQTANEPSASTEHEIELTSLSPNTTYYYSVGSAVDTLAGGDANYSFKTHPVAGASVNARFWVLGDCGRANEDQRTVRDAFYSFTGPLIPDATLLLGDNAYDDGTDSEYQAAVFDMYSAMNRKTPLWSCLGNHETAQFTDFVDTYPYFQVFTFPTAGECGGVPSGTEHYYSFDYGNVHVISLDSMTASRSPTGAMANWLQSDLASTTARWIIAIFHHPPYSKGSHDSDEEVELAEMRQNILPILEAGGVDLVLNGHSHAYERSYLLDGHYGLSSTLTDAMRKNGGDGRVNGDGAYVKPLTGPRDHFGAVYTVTGAASQVSGGALDHPAMYISMNNLGSLVLDINGNQLDATYLREDGSTPDTFTILKEGAADSDGDGIPDEYEIAHGLDRHNPADANGDLDGDGITNLGEYLLGLAADVPDHYNWVVTRDLQSHNMAIAFPTLPGRKYQVEWSPDLSIWRPASAVYPGDGSTRTVIDDGSVSGTPSSTQTRRFYRIRVSAP